MNLSPLSSFKGWWIFLRERFEPISTSLMILSLTAANATIAHLWEPSSFQAGPLRLLGGYCLVWLVFFHMRLFDEVKDYDTDLDVNPERPLPKGVVTLDGVGRMTLFCFVLEVALAASLGFPVLSAWCAVAGFTLLMRMEFFIGDWMRPKMELYATSHTFSATLMGLLVFSIVTNRPLSELPLAYLLAALGNWFVFNVFEFGRKTFGKEEERENVDSYSLRLNPAGAFLLLAVNIVLAWLCLQRTCGLIYLSRFAPGPDPLSLMLGAAGGISLVVFLAGIFYAMQPQAMQAKFYRGVVTLYLLAYHVAIAAAGLTVH